MSRVKVSHFAAMFVLGYLLNKNIAPREIHTLTQLVDAPLGLSWHREGAEEGEIYRTFATFHPVKKIAQHLLYRRKFEK